MLNYFVVWQYRSYPNSEWLIENDVILQKHPVVWLIDLLKLTEMQPEPQNQREIRLLFWAPIDGALYDAALEVLQP